MIGAKFGMYGESGLITEYDKDNLFVWLDGKNNNGLNQHSQDTTTWVNLGSGGASYNATRSSGTWGDTCAVLNGADTLVFSIENNIMGGVMCGEWTVQVVFSMTSNNFVNYRGLLGSHGYASSHYGIVLFQYGDGYFTNGIWGTSSGTAAFDAKASDFAPNKKYVVTLCESLSENNIQVYINDLLKSSVDTIYQLTTTKPLKIGSSYYNTGRALFGNIYSVRIYTRKLTLKDILRNYKVDKLVYGI